MARRSTMRRRTCPKASRFRAALAASCLPKGALSKATAAPKSATSEPGPSLVDLLTGSTGYDFQGPAEGRELCLVDDKLTLQFLASPSEFGARHEVLAADSNVVANATSPQPQSSEVTRPYQRRLLPADKIQWSGRPARRKDRCQVDKLVPSVQTTLKSSLFPLKVESLRRVFLDHLERIFDIGRVYHDFYAGVLAENGASLQTSAKDAQLGIG
eukprot:TRINITY_DN29358_c0_g1_i1.p1 TRINITY_DN29358_c0_g1~~TRINITY_DN29358_c0_g1_i1.p1  ORF type:complete len:214 (+),score=27.08 TRINITY_DN29358_c0_g1_i1:146-787(+)